MGYSVKRQQCLPSVHFLLLLFYLCVLLAGLMFLPSSSRNMQRGCKISCCQMIIEIFFSSGERSLRIWMFSLKSDQGQISERGAGSDTKVELILDVSVFPASVMISLRESELMHHSTFEQIYCFTETWVLWKPAFLLLIFWDKKPRPPAPLPSLCPGQWAMVGVSAVSQHWPSLDHGEKNGKCCDCQSLCSHLFCWHLNWNLDTVFHQYT